MTAWPSLTPDALEVLAPVGPPVVTEQWVGHGPVDFLVSGIPQRARIQLSYLERSAAVIDELRTCYQFRRGMAISFLLPAEIWAAHPDPEAIASADSRWRFESEPEEEDLGYLLNWSATLVQAN